MNTHFRPSNFSRNIDWNLLKVFHEIVEAGGVSRAGHVLRRKQPALSLALKRLETQLGVTLCRRGPRGFELTDEGMLVAETCQSLSSLVRNVPKRLGNLAEEVAARNYKQTKSRHVCDQIHAALTR
jgi:DNA-binding transcriptional LysR family regulator